VERLDQGHLHPKPEVPRGFACPGRESNPQWEASTLEKIHSNSLFNCYSEPLQVERFSSNVKTAKIRPSHPPPSRQLSRAAKDISSHLGTGLHTVAENLEGAFIQLGEGTATRAGCVTRPGDPARPVPSHVLAGSRILIFTHPGSRIPKQLQKRGVKKIYCHTFFVATNFT
jgi:hypothetical protein